MPRGTPWEVTATLSAGIVASEDFRARLRGYGLVPAGGTPGEFARFLAEDAAAWAKVVRDNDIRVE